MAMRTAPFAPYPLFLLPMPDGGRGALARLLHERGEEVGGANGALPAVADVRRRDGPAAAADAVTVADAHAGSSSSASWCRAGAGRAAAAGARTRTPDLALAWFEAFHARRRRAGRPRRRARGARRSTPEDVLAPDRARAAAGSGRTTGEPVHLTGAQRRRRTAWPGSARSTRRGSTAGAATRARPSPSVSQQLLDEGARVCLFTDQANPTSNGVYEAIGYEPVVDMVNLLVGRSRRRSVDSADDVRDPRARPRQHLRRGRATPCWPAGPRPGSSRRWTGSRRSPSCSASPQRAYPVIHLTGTNGKTSTSRMIDTLLRAHRAAHRPVHQPARGVDDRADLASTASR